MVITINEVRKLIFQVLNNAITREEASTWAFDRREAYDNGQLCFSPVNLEEILWESILFIEGLDLQDKPHNYLHNADDILAFQKKIGYI